MKYEITEWIFGKVTLELAGGFRIAVAEPPLFNNGIFRTQTLFSYDQVRGYEP